MGDNYGIDPIPPIIKEDRREPKEETLDEILGLIQCQSGYADWIDKWWRNRNGDPMNRRRK